jgi:uncharacterized protein YdhG (YjbR/CyaY superfamily)
VKSAAATVEAYLAELPADRRNALEKLRAIILANLPAGYVEAMSWGMIAYEVPLAIAPKTYNGKPLMYAALASQKNHMAVYLCGLYCTPGALDRFKASWKAKKLDMGVACLRFKKVEDLDLEAIGRVIAQTPVADFAAASQR